jgi:hypothetical protein
MLSYRAMPVTQELSRMDMNEPRLTRTLLTKEVWSIYLSRHAVRRDIAQALTPLRATTPARVRLFR